MKKKAGKKRSFSSSLGWRVLKGLGKIVVVYPIKGLYYCFYYSCIYSVKGIRTLYHQGKERLARNNVERQRPKSLPTYQALVEVKRKRGEFSSFENRLLGKSTIGIILGARGSGKTALGMRLLENAAAREQQKKTYALGFNVKELPPWITAISSIAEIENNAVLLVDEGGIEFSSRSSMSHANKLLSEIILIARHKDLSVMFIAQNSANLEINAIRQADYLLLKPSSLLQKDFERKKIREMYEEVEQDFSEWSTIEGLVYVYADTYQGFARNALPSFWSDRISKGYSHRKEYSKK